MKVKQLSTGKVLSVNDSYGTRLIEQGQAVLVKEKPKAAAVDKVRKPKAANGPD